MNTRRELRGGLKDLTGERRGSLVVEDIAQRSPLRWRVRCSDPSCNLSTVFDHGKLQSGAVKDCPNAALHGATAQPRSSLVATVNKSVAIRSRDSQSAREFHEQETEQQRQRAEAAEERQAAEVEDRKRTLSERRERFFVAEGMDPQFQIDPNTLEGRISVPVAQLGSWNRAEAERFKQNCPDYANYRSDATFEALTRYISSHANLKLVSAKQWQWAFERLKSLGLIQPNPAPLPEEERHAAPAAVNLSVTPATGSPDDLVDCWDPVTGEPTRMTVRALDKLDSTSYRRALRLYSVEAAIHLGLPGADRTLIAAGKEAPR